MLTTKNPIFDVSKLSRKFLNKKTAKENLRQILVLLSQMRTVSGICLSNYEYPEILSTFASLISNFRSLKIVHFSNCGATTGLKDLADSIVKSNNNRISYWDLSYNKFNNFEPFATIISNSKSPVRYINLNYCEISHSGSIAFFDALANFERVHQLQYLSIAKMALSDDDSIAAFRSFLKVSDLLYLDLSSMEKEISAVLSALFKEEQSKLQTLILNDLPIDDGVVSLINKILKKTDSLTELSLSRSSISPTNLASIIKTINENRNIKSFSLNLDNLKLNKANLRPVLEAFLASAETNAKSKSKSSKRKSDPNQDENKEDYTSKWEKLSFASNSMNSDDLDILITAISNLQNLLEINLDDNFDSSMEDIDNILCRLSELENLVKISIAGGASNRLKDKLIPFLEAIAEAGRIQELDIRNNDIKDISSIQTVIKGCKSLQVLKLDNNGFSDFKKIGSTLKKAKNLTQFNFPTNDCKRIIKRNSNDPEIIEATKDYMRNLMQIVTENREAQNLYCELPFETTLEVEGLINELSKKAYENLEENNIEDLTEHSYVSEVFGLPFPCQKLSAIFRKERYTDSHIFFKKANTEEYGETEKSVQPDKKLKCYDVSDSFESDVFNSNVYNSMKKVLIEHSDLAGLYPEFFSAPTVGNHIKEMFDSYSQAQGEEDEENTPRNKSKRSSKAEKNQPMERSLGNTNNSNLENDENFDDSEDSNFQNKLNRTQKYLITEKDNNKAEDEKSRIQFGNADIRQVEDISLNLETRCLDKDDLDNLADTSFEPVNKIKKKRSNAKEGVSRSEYRSKGSGKSTREQIRSSNEERKSRSNSGINNNTENKRSNEVVDNKEKSIDSKKREILFDPAYANSSSDDEHLEKLRKQNLKGSSKKKSSTQQQQQPPPNKQQEEPKPKQKPKKVVVPSSESSSDGENNNIMKQRNARNISNSDEADSDDRKAQKAPGRQPNKRSKVLSSSSDEDSEGKDRKRSSNAQQLRRKKQQDPEENEEEEEEQERKRRRKQPERRRQLQQQESDEEEDQEQERRRKQQQQQRLRQQQQESDEEEEQERRRKQQQQQRLRQQQQESDEEEDQEQERRRKQQQQQRLRQQQQQESDEDEEEQERRRKQQQQRMRQQQLRQQQQESDEEEEEQEQERRRKQQQERRRQQQLRQQQESDEEEEEQERRRRQPQQQQPEIDGFEEEEEEEQERRSPFKQPQDQRRKQQAMFEEEEKGEEEDQQEILRQQERRRQQQLQQQEEQERIRQQQQQQELEKQSKMAKKQQTPPPKKGQTLRELLNSTSEEISDDEQRPQPNRKASNSQRMKPNNEVNHEMSRLQKPPNSPDPGTAINYAQDLLKEKKPKPSKIPLKRKVPQ